MSDNENYMNCRNHALVCDKCGEQMTINRDVGYSFPMKYKAACGCGHTKFIVDADIRMRKIVFDGIIEALNLSIYCPECRGKMKRYRRDGENGIIHVCDECGHFEKENG